MKRHLFRRMGRFLRPQAPSLAGAAALAALSGLLALLVPLVAGWAVEAIGTGPGAADLTAVLRCCAAGLGAAVLSAVCSYGASAALVRVGQTVSYTLRKAAFQQITQLPVRYFDTHPAGDLISRVCYDVDTVNAALSIDLLQIGTSLLTVIGSFVMLLMLSPLLSGVFFLTVPLSVLLTRLQMKHIHPLFRRRSQELGALNSFAEERVSCQRAIRVYGVEAADLRQFAEKNDAASETYYKADCASTALGPSVNFINNLSLAAVSVFGALLYLGGGLSLGALSSFVLYSRKFSGPIRETAELLSDLQASVAAAERVLDLLDQPAEDGDLPGAREPGKLSGAISFRHVDFGYDPAHPVLRDFSADIPAGSMVAVVGPPGPARPPWSPSCCGSIRPRRAPSPLTDCPSSSTPGTASGVAWPSSCRTAGCAAAPSRKTSPTACRALPAPRSRPPPRQPVSIPFSPPCRMDMIPHSLTAAPASPRASGSCWPLPAASSPMRTS